MVEPGAPASSRTTPSDEFPRVRVVASQVERYRFELTYPGTSLLPETVDEGPPMGGGSGPDPALALAGAVGHCLSSTFYNTLERSRVRTTPIRTTVALAFGRNARGRKRVATLEVEIECAPLDEGERERFDRAASIFEDYCTVTGSVREGVQVEARIVAPATP